jgi:hypothetical protein
MTEREFRRPSDDPGAADPVADGEPTPGNPGEWTDEAPGSGDWKKADNERPRAGDRDREIAETGDGRHGTTPREFSGHDLPGSEVGGRGAS